MSAHCVQSGHRHRACPKSENDPQRTSTTEGSKSITVAEADAVGFERPVRKLLDEGDDFGVSPEIGFFARDIGNHRRVGTDRDFLLTVLVFDHQGLVVIAGNRLRSDSSTSSSSNSSDIPGFVSRL